MNKLSWKDVEKAADELAAKILASGFVPDCIIGITTGGLIPLYFLANKLDIDSILTVSATSYKEREQKLLSVTYVPDVDMTGKNVLLVDEVAETGASLRGVVEAVQERLHPAQLKTATLATNTKTCTSRPDYTAIEATEWVEFPWEHN